MQHALRFRLLLLQFKSGNLDLNDGGILDLSVGNWCCIIYTFQCLSDIVAYPIYFGAAFWCICEIICRFASP
jgi:hypothetical protein